MEDYFYEHFDATGFISAHIDPNPPLVRLEELRDFYMGIENRLKLYRGEFPAMYFAEGTVEDARNLTDREKRIEFLHGSHAAIYKRWLEEWRKLYAEWKMLEIEAIPHPSPPGAAPQPRFRNIEERAARRAIEMVREMKTWKRTKKN